MENTVDNISNLILSFLYRAAKQRLSMFEFNLKADIFKGKKGENFAMMAHLHELNWNRHIEDIAAIYCRCSKEGQEEILKALDENKATAPVNSKSISESLPAKAIVQSIDKLYEAIKLNKTVSGDETHATKKPPKK